MNVLCVGSRIIGIMLAQEICTSFLNAQFTAEERHVRRTNMVKALEDEMK